MVKKMSETNSNPNPSSLNSGNSSASSSANTNVSSNSSTKEKKRFELLPKESIQLMAEQNGFDNLTEEAILLLSSDVNFRVRELVHNSVECMRHSKRRRLTASDVNRALEWSDCEKVLGFEAKDSDINNVYVKDANVFISDDPMIDLNEEMNKIFDKTFCGIKLFENDIHLSIDWLSVDARLESNEDIDCETSVECSEELKDYYQNVVKAILGTDNQSFVMALKDLSSNCHISPVLPYLLNFIMTGVRRLSHDISQLKRFLHTIECLFRNPSLFLATDPYLNVLIQSILECIVEPLNPISDHWTLRDSASHLLVNVLNEWFTPFVANRLLNQTITSLRNCLLDFSKPFSSHYGAIKAFQSLGYDIIVEHLYPILNQYFKHLLPVINANQSTTNSQIRTDGLRVFGELLFIAELICLKLRSIIKSINSETKIDSQVYNQMSDIFGDSLSARLPIDCEKFRLRVYTERNKNLIKSPTNLFETPESLQTGEELLDAFYEAPNHTEDMRSELSANLEDDNSCYDNSIASDNEKETVATDVLQIKSTISDPTLGIKLTFKKLRRDQNESVLEKRNRMNRMIAHNSDPIFEFIRLKQTSIRFNISGFDNVVVQRGPKQPNYYPSQWFILTMISRKQLKSRTNYKIVKKDSKHLKLYSCDLFNVL